MKKWYPLSLVCYLLSRVESTYVTQTQFLITALHILPATHMAEGLVNVKYLWKKVHVFAYKCACISEFVIFHLSELLFRIYCTPISNNYSCFMSAPHYIRAISFEPDRSSVGFTKKKELNCSCSVHTTVSISQYLSWIGSCDPVQSSRLRP